MDIRTHITIDSRTVFLNNLYLNNDNDDDDKIEELINEISKELRRVKKDEI